MAHDIILISYDEANAEEHYSELKNKFSSLN